MNADLMLSLMEKVDVIWEEIRRLIFRGDFVGTTTTKAYIAYLEGIKDGMRIAYMTRTDE